MPTPTQRNARAEQQFFRSAEAAPPDPTFPPVMPGLGMAGNGFSGEGLSFRSALAQLELVHKRDLLELTSWRLRFNTGTTLEAAKTPGQEAVEHGWCAANSHNSFSEMDWQQWVEFILEESRRRTFLESQHLLATDGCHFSTSIEGTHHKEPQNNIVDAVDFASASAEEGGGHVDHVADHTAAFGLSVDPFMKTNVEATRHSSESSSTKKRVSVKDLFFPKPETISDDESFQNIKHILEQAREAHETHVLKPEFNGHESLAFIRSEEFERSFDIVMAVIILFNVLQIGISADLGRHWKGWNIIDAFFGFAFVLELVFKITVHGFRQHFCGPGCGMNIFDLFIVLLALFELYLYTQNAPFGGVTVFRIIRLLRLGRIFKFLRMPIFSELRAMMDGLIDGSRILFWSMILLITPVYTVAVIMRETVGESSLKGHPDYDHLIKPFGTFSAAFFTAFRCIMGDCTTHDGLPLIPLITQEFGWMFALGFAGVTVVTTFGLFNVIAAIYVDNIQAAAGRMHARNLQVRLCDKGRNLGIMGELVRIFVVEAALNSGCDTSSWEEMVTDKDIELNKELFDKVMRRDDVRKFLDMLDIRAENRVDLFSVLDSDGGGSLSLSEILKGFQMLRGDPRRTDVVSVRLVLRTLQEQQNLCMKSLTEMHEENAQALREFKEETKRRYTELSKTSVTKR